MNGFFIEINKGKRTGMMQIMPLVCVLGVLYTFVFISYQKETLLSLDLTFSEMLLTQASSFVIVLNLFGIILMASLIYHMEYCGNAIRKMHMLPIKAYILYLNKLLICLVSLFVSVVMEHVGLFMVARFIFPSEVLHIADFFTFGFYSFVSSLPVLSFMLLISSRNENVWIVIGIGVVGFLSGMTMAMGNGVVFLLNPFVLMLKPSVNSIIEPQALHVAISLASSVLFTLGGVFLAEKSFCE